MTAASECIRLRIDILVVVVKINGIDAWRQRRYIRTIEQMGIEKWYEHAAPKNVQCQLQIYLSDDKRRSEAALGQHKDKSMLMQ